MKITARVTFTKYANREFLVQAFFDKREFSPNNKICILDDETAFVQLEFDKQPPMFIIKALSYCKINVMDNMEASSIEELIKDYESEYNHDTLADLEDKTTDEVADAEPDTISDDGTHITYDDEPDDAYEDISDEVLKDDASTDVDSNNHDEEPSELETKSKSTKKLRRGRATPSENDYLDVPMFDDLAEHSYSFSGFVTNVGKWMNFSEEDASYFFELTMALSKYDQKAYELRLKQIKEANANLGYTDYRRVSFSKKLTKLLEDYHICSTMIPFLCTVLKYNGNIMEHKNKSVGDSSVDDDSAHDVSVTADVSNETENSSSSDTTELTKAADTGASTETSDNGKAADEKDEESQLINNPNFASIMAGVNRDATLEEQIKVLLSKMGLEKESKLLYNKACAITLAAFSMETLESIDAVMQKAGMDTSSKDGLRTKIKFCEWINSYNKANHIKRMKVITFLRELKIVFTLE
ncbi:MAG: hypothetical protein IJH12_09480 [Clostridia bacterium]|nr:hypothetical protein [Clostridia bacterium]